MAARRVDCPSHIWDWGRGQHLRASWSVFSANIVYYLELVGVPTVEDGSEGRRNLGLLDTIDDLVFLFLTNTTTATSKDNFHSPTKKRYSRRIEDVWARNLLTVPCNSKY